MKAYKTSYKKVFVNDQAPDAGTWFTEYFSEPHDALSYLVKHGVDTAANKTADDVRNYTTNGSTMQIISTIRTNPSIFALTADDVITYHVLGDISVIDIKEQIK